MNITRFPELVISFPLSRAQSIYVAEKHLATQLSIPEIYNN